MSFEHIQINYNKSIKLVNNTNSKKTPPKKKSGPKNKKDLCLEKFTKEIKYYININNLIIL